MSDLSRLPKPTEYGSYWFGSHADPTDPAIFRSSRVNAEGDVTHSGKYFVSLGSIRGIVFEGSEIKYFDTPQDALKEIRKKLQ